MSSRVMDAARAATLLALGLAIGGMGVSVANADDAPGAAVIGFLLMLAAVVLGVRIVRRRLPVWAGRAALGGGVVVAAFAAWLSHAVTVAAPLYLYPQDVPSIGGLSPSPRWGAAVDRARPMVRSAVAKPNLPGVSIAVGVDGDVVWSEGFGWRDVVTQTPVTPATRFVIGTAAPAITAAAATALGLTDTGAESAAEWSPGHVGEPEEDFPGFTLVHNLILRPLGISAAAEPLPGERATFYVPRSGDNDSRRGRRLMYMRDLACCAGGMAFYSTPSDLVRVAMATKTGSLDGELAGGSVMSLMTRDDTGIVVAVASNVAHANTAAIASQVADAFAEQP